MDRCKSLGTIDKARKILVHTSCGCNSHQVTCAQLLWTVAVNTAMWRQNRRNYEPAQRFQLASLWGFVIFTGLLFYMVIHTKHEYSPLRICQLNQSCLILFISLRNPWARIPGPNFIQQILRFLFDFHFIVLPNITTQKGILTFRWLLYENEWCNNTNQWWMRNMAAHFSWFYEINLCLSKFFCYS